MQHIRCAWVSQDPIYQEYHDKVWGRPVRNKYELFAKLCLDGQQAGLSWITILKKRENFRIAFDNFDYKKIANYKQGKFDELIVNAGIIRNKLKIKSAITNAQLFMQIQKEFGSFSTYIWAFVDGKPIVNSFDKREEVPATTLLSDTISKDLKKRGFKFVGSTIIYAFMQATGMVNDHTTDCFCYTK